MILNGREPYRFLIDLGANVLNVRRSDILVVDEMRIGAARFREVWLGFPVAKMGVRRGHTP